ncbi:MAG TPA: bifunctional (p)ppGpp synthetase/guanosine-3',5'-bis(diphosphate) 3'-pyrophosphohydrolase [bacterium]|nr:bifunctional (p)ppGpp synthetase/guanosine-3',5'-bis(diphosphate) 3'-pyrophosphohydrolase [bacterium]
MPVIRINEIIDRLLDYHPQADVAIVQKAYVWSAKLHAGSLRKSGLPYLSHPLEVAGILTELKLHESAIAAGLLHDVLEDSSLTLEGLEAEFGREIARLVDGVTKIGKITADTTRIEVQAENLRKMVLAMAEDVRVILIKLADRLHNMRTLEYLEEDRRRLIAQETMEIYAPVAGRLGIHWIRAQLEDLSLEHLKPDIFFRLAAQVAKTREARQQYVEETQQTLQKLLSEAGVEAAVTGRFKHIFSVLHKMEKQNLAFEEVHDLIAFRILVNTINDCYDALRVIHSSWTPVPGRIKDYIALPKPNMYRSLHTTVIGPDGERVEIQIRTHEMHAIAEYGIAAHWRYKEIGAAAPGKKAEAKALEFVQHLVEYHEELKDPYRFLESVKSEVAPEEIIVFTPKGDMIELPQGATAIDLAFAIHSHIGNHCAGAKVNGRIVPLNHPLKSGDTIEIITLKSVEPSRAWLDLVKTPRAKAKITHWITMKEADRVKETGRRILETELFRYDRRLGELIENGTMDRIAQRFNFNGHARLFEAVGFGKFPARKVVLQLVPADEVRDKGRAKGKAGPPKKAGKKIGKKAGRKKPAARGKAAPAAADGESSADEVEKPVMLITSFGDPSLSFASCCHPLAEDEAVALRREDQIIEVHRANCPRVTGAHPERILPAKWADHVEGESEGAIDVVAQDQKGMLVKISSVISDANLDIIRALVHTTEDKKAKLSFHLCIKSLSQLQRLIKAIEKIDAVISVHRM